jgi:hydrogenase maturation protein HypF
VINDRVNERPVAEIARAFHRGLARGLSQAVDAVSEMYDVDIAVLSGGVFQNELLLEEFKIALPRRTIWTNHNVPANDGGISLGQAALAAFHHFDSPSHGTRHA